MSSVGTRLKEALNTTPYKFQIKGIRFVEKQKGRALICDDMGLGKTLQAIGWAAIHPEARPAVVICPASVKYSWQREFKKHANIKSYVCNGTLPTKEDIEKQRKKSLRLVRKKKFKTLRGRRMAVLRVNRKARQKRKDVARLKRQALKAEVLIINYDIIEAWADTLVDGGIQLFILDECQYVKSEKAQRTKACTRISRECQHIIGLSGTPISGKPIEFYPILNMIRPEEFNNRWQFGMMYGDPKKGYKGRWTFSGSSNLEALHARLKTLMIRRMKTEVLKDLPKKTRTIVPVDIDNQKEYRDAEDNFLSWVAKKKGSEAARRASRAEAIVRLNGLKLIAAQGKLNRVRDWLSDWFNDTDEKLIVFAYHKPIIEFLKKEYPTAALVDGTVSGKKRQQEVRRFQKDKKCRLFIGQRTAAGTGLDGLQHASCNVVFLEIGWTPGEHDQAEDRALRIGQVKHVNVYYLVGKGTVEERILGIIEEKDKVVSQILDGKPHSGMQLLQEFLAKVDEPKKIKVKRIKNRKKIKVKRIQK